MSHILKDEQEYHKHTFLPSIDDQWGRFSKIKLVSLIEYILPQSRDWVQCLSVSSALSTVLSINRLLANVYQVNKRINENIYHKT